MENSINGKLEDFWKPYRLTDDEFDVTKDMAVTGEMTSNEEVDEQD